MTLNIIIVLVSLIIIALWLPIAFKLIFKRRFKKYVMPVVLAGLLVLISVRLGHQFVYGYILLVFPKVWTTKWSHGLLVGLTAGILDELVRYLILRYCHRHGGKWIRGRRRTLAFALGQGWIYAFFTWGLYLLDIVKIWAIGDISTYGLEPLPLIWGLVEVIASIFLFIGMTYLVKYGISVHKGVKFTVVAILYHSLAVALLYYIEYLFNLPAAVAELVFAVMAVGSWLFGMKLMNGDQE